MSLNQPTALDLLEHKKQTIHANLNLLKKHEPNWTEAAQLSAKHTRYHLKKQLTELDKVISWVKEYK